MRKVKVEDFVRKNVKAMQPYRSARDEFWGDDFVLLDANENPIESGINRYPDPYQRELKDKIGSIKGLDASQIFIGNGSDEIIDMLYRCFCEPYQDTALTVTPSFGMYKVHAQLNAVDIRFCSLNEDFTISVDRLISEIEDTDKLLFLCTPNNPTGNLIPVDKIVSVAKHFHGFVVVDEAYIDFSNSESLVSYLHELDNLIVLQTLSKAWAAAGLRIGMAFAKPEIIYYLNKIKAPYNVSILSQKRAIELLGNSKEYEEVKAQILQERDRLIPELEECACVLKVYPSDTNFLLVKFKDSMEVYNILKNNGVIVRDRSKTHLCEGCLRITVGIKEENRRMVQILKAIQA